MLKTINSLLEGFRTVESKTLKTYGKEIDALLNQVCDVSFFVSFVLNSAQTLKPNPFLSFL